MAIEKGFTYNPETGQVFGIYGKEITAKTKDGYIKFIFYNGNKPYTLYGHQFAWYYINKECVNYLDHINNSKIDNRICNLRSVTNQENGFNTKAKGYSWSKQANKWRAIIKVNRKSINLGYFHNEVDARAAYLEAKEKYHIIK